MLGMPWERLGRGSPHTSHTHSAALTPCAHVSNAAKGLLHLLLLLTHNTCLLMLSSRACVAQFVDALARDTVTLAAMGKRDMQALEAMGVADLDKEFLGFNRTIKNTKASINNSLVFD